MTKQPEKTLNKSTILLHVSLITILFISLVEATNLDCTSSCGDIKNITHPFRLNTDPSICGDSDYELYCQNNKTVLKFRSVEYTVKHIDYVDSTIHVVDSNFENGTCSIPAESEQSPKKVEETITGDFRYHGEQIRHSYVSFYSCSERVAHPAYARVPCFDPTSRYVVYAVLEGHLLQQMEACSVMTMVPVDYNFDFDGGFIKFPPYETILQLLQSGLDLGWSVTCRDCFRSGHSCSTTSFDPSISHCDQPLSHPVYGYTIYLDMLSLVLTFLLDIILFGRYIIASVVIYVFLGYKFCATKKTIEEDGDNWMVEENGDGAEMDPPHMSIEEVQSESSTEWLIPESTEKS